MGYNNKSNKTQTMLSQSASVAGNNKNPHNYMSPEVYRSNNFSTNKNKTTNRTIPTTQPNTTIDTRCDVYSFALVCWTIFSHQIPFQHLTPPAFEEFVVDGGTDVTTASLPPFHSEE